MKICIYDLSARYEAQVRDSETKNLLFAYKLPPALIEKDGKHSNLQFSFFEPEIPDFSSFIDLKTGNGLRYSYNNDCLLTLTEIMYSLCFSNEIDDSCEAYFKGVSILVSSKIKKKGINIDETIILVPDALSLNSQEKLLAYFGRYHTSLLWHSMAVALGLENVFLEKAAEGEKIALVDEFSNIGTFSSKIEIKKENGRAIPCHKIYMKSKGLNTGWYKKDQGNVLHKSIIDNVVENRLTASFRQSGFKYTITIDSSNRPIEEEICSLNIPAVDIENASMIITSNLVTVISSKMMIPRVIVDIGEQAFLGAVKFVDYVTRGMVPYYDECESFSVVCQNNKEELEYFELVNGNSYLPGGKRIDGNVIDILFIPKGSKKAKFYFHLGDVKDKMAQLKLYIQEFPIEDSLEENRRLRLSPSVIPGQGYAQIVIEDFEQKKLFSPIELDWKNMNSAFSDKGNPITIRYLELTLERSFPPDVPPVRSRYAVETSGSAKLALRELVSGNFSYSINNSIWPNINDYSKGVDRFVRQNTFGSYVKGEENEYRFPRVPGISNIQYVNAFKLAANKYLDGNDVYLKSLAWSYLRYDLNGELIPELTEVTKRVIRTIQIHPKYACPAVHSSYLANMIVTEEEFEAVFLRFREVLNKKGDGIGNWCRAMYQLLMYTPFIYGKSKKIGQCATICMYMLVEYLESVLIDRKKKVVDNILRVMLYLLKRRVIDKEYLQKNYQPDNYNRVVGVLGEVKNKITDKFINETADSIIKYIDGKGTLDGIPAPLDN